MDPPSEEALFSFERGHMRSTVYRNEGDTTLYSTINLKKRTAVREDAQVQGWLSTFFSTFNHADLNGNGHADEIHRQDVLEFELLVCKALFDTEDWDMEQAKQAVVDDLQREIGDATNMDASEFFHSLFETVDVWTETVEVDEYVAFLRNLYLRITYTDPSFAGGRRFKEVKNVIAFSEVDTTYDSEHESDMLDDSHVHDVSPKAGGDGHELPTHDFELQAAQDGAEEGENAATAEGKLGAQNLRKRSNMLMLLLRKSPRASLLGPSFAEADTDALDTDVPAHSAANEDVPAHSATDASDMAEATHGVARHSSTQIESTQASHDHVGKAGQTTTNCNSKLNAKRLLNNKTIGQDSRRSSSPERDIIEGETRGDGAAKQEKSYFLAGGNRDDSNGRGVYGGLHDAFSDGDPLGERRGGSMMGGGGGAKDTPVYLGGGDDPRQSAPARASVFKPSRPQQQQQQQQQQHSQPRQQSELHAGHQSELQHAGASGAASGAASEHVGGTRAPPARRGGGTMASTGVNANGDAATAASAAEASAAEADTLATSEERSATKPARTFVVCVSLMLFCPRRPSRSFRSLSPTGARATHHLRRSSDLI